MAYKTKESQLRAQREWYKKNKKRQFDNVKRRKKELRDRFQEFKKTLKCCVCKESEACCLDFHHLDASEKEFSIAHFENVGLAKLKEELKKCVVICSNCHRKVHEGILVLDSNCVKPIDLSKFPSGKNSGKLLTKNPEFAKEYKD